MRAFFLLAGLALLSACPSGGLSAATFDWTGTSLGADHVVELRLWLPDGAPPLRGVILLVPGANGDGRPLAEDADWRALAAEQGVALLGCSLRGEQGGAYYNAEHWSGADVVHGLNELAARAGHPELARAPLLLWGHSAGGEFNYSLACWVPERVLAFVVNKGAYYTTAANDGSRRVPGLWIAGETDEDQRLQNITSLFGEGRRLGARWSLAIEPKTGHEIGRTKELGILFLRAVLVAQAREGILPDQVWVGNLATHAIRAENSAPPAPGTRPPLDAWLPGEDAARAWKAFVEGRLPAGKFTP